MKTTGKTSQWSKTSGNKDVRIFVVDDDPVYRQAMEFRLRKNPDYKIYSFKTGEECLKHFQFLNPDIVVLDYNFSSKNQDAADGLEILKKLRAFDSRKPVLILSGEEGVDTAENFIKHGAFDFIAKNENAFIRLGNLVNEILNHRNVELTGRKQESYRRMVIAIIITTIIGVFTISNILIPGLISVLTTILFIPPIVLLVQANRNPT